MKHGKKYTDSRKLVDSTKLYEPAEALDLCAKTGKAKFDETVEIHVRLGVDSRHADSRSVVQSYCPTVPVSPSACCALPAAMPPRLPRPPVPSLSVPRT